MSISHKTELSVSTDFTLGTMLGEVAVIKLLSRLTEIASDFTFAYFSFLLLNSCSCYTFFKRWVHSYWHLFPSLNISTVLRLKFHAEFLMYQAK